MRNGADLPARVLQKPVLPYDYITHGRYSRVRGGTDALGARVVVDATDERFSKPSSCLAQLGDAVDYLSYR